MSERDEAAAKHRRVVSQRCTLRSLTIATANRAWVMRAAWRAVFVRAQRTRAKASHSSMPWEAIRARLIFPFRVENLPRRPRIGDGFPRPAAAPQE